MLWSKYAGVFRMEGLKLLIALLDTSTQVTTLHGLMGKRGTGHTWG